MQGNIKIDRRIKGDHSSNHHQIISLVKKEERCSKVQGESKRLFERVQEDIGTFIFHFDLEKVAINLT